MRPLLAAALCFATLACGKPPSPVAPSQPPAPAAPASEVPVAEAASPAVAAPAPASPAAAEPTLCEVELSGAVTAAVGSPDTPFAFVAIGDCLDPAAKVLGRDFVNKQDGKWFIEVFPPCGTDLTVCASVEPAAAMPNAPGETRRYGKLDRLLHAQGVGEIEFKELTVPVADGPPRTFATPFAR